MVRCATCPVRHRGLCAVLDDASLAILSAGAERLTLPPGASCALERDEAGSFVVLVNGNARLVANLADGRRQILRFVSGGDVLSPPSAQELGQVGDHVPQAVIEAIGPLAVCRLSAASVDGLSERLPRLDRHLREETREELARARAQIVLLGRRSARGRLAAFLLSLAPPEGRADTLLALPMTREDIADYLGLTIETVSRTLTALARDGVIAVEMRHDVRILRPGALRSIAAGED